MKIAAVVLSIAALGVALHAQTACNGYLSQGANGAWQCDIQAPPKAQIPAPCHAVPTETDTFPCTGPLGETVLGLIDDSQSRPIPPQEHEGRDDVRDGDTIVIHLSDDEKKQLAAAKAKVKAAQDDQSAVQGQIASAHLPPDFYQGYGFPGAGSYWTVDEDFGFPGFIIVTRKEIQNWTYAIQPVGSHQ